jgi:DNA-binding NarL/FixJ family response regulator
MDPIRILITDNSNEFAALLRERLEFYPGIRVVGIAHNALHALHILRQTAVDVLLLDIIMPGMDGLELLDDMSQLENKPLVFIVSAIGTNAIIQQAMRLGAAGFFVKPVECDKLVASIAAAINADPFKNRYPTVP